MLMKIAALVVVIVVIAAAAIVLTGGGDGDDKPTYFEGEDPVLSVFGNADGDRALDSRDIDVIEDVISRGGSAREYPLCDANQDGVVDSEDVALVEKLIAGEECRVNVLCLDRDGNAAAVEVDYPLRDVATFGSSINANILYIGAEGNVAGYNAATYPNFEARLIASGAANFGGSSTKFNFAGFTAMDGALYEKNGKGVGAFIIDATRAGNIDDSTYQALTASEVPLLFFNVIRMSEEVSVTVTLGFLFGGSAYSKAIELADVCEPIIEKVGDITSRLPEDDRKVVVGITMSTMLMPATSDNYINFKEAGGVPLHERDASFNGIIDIGTSLKLTTTENVLVNYDDRIDNIISVRSIDAGIGDLSVSMVSTWEKNMRFFEDLDCYEGFFYINNLLPATVKIAYMVENLYPDLVPAGFGDDAFRAVAAMCPYLDGCTLENTFTDCTYSDYIVAKNGGDGGSDEPSETVTATAKAIAEAFLAANPTTVFASDAATIAGTIASTAKIGGWAVKEGAGEDSAVLVYTAPSGSTKEIPVKRVGTAAGTFASLSASLAAESNYTPLDVSGIADVNVAAAYRTIPAGHLVVKFVVQYGSVVVDAYSDALVNLGSDGTVDEALEVVSCVCAAVAKDARPVSWSIKDGATDSEAVLVESYEGSKGAAAKEISIVRGTGATKSAFDIKAAGIPSSYEKVPVTVDGSVSCTAAAKAMGSIYVVKFVLLYGDVLIDGATEYLASYNADAADAEACVQAFIAAMTIPA